MSACCLMALSVSMSLLLFCLDVFSVFERNVEVSNCNCGCMNFSFQLYQPLLHILCSSAVGMYTFRIGMSSWWIDPFVIMYCPFLFLVIFFVLRFTLLDNNIATPTFI